MRGRGVESVFTHYFYCALPALIIGLCVGHRLFLSSIECNIQGSVKDFVFSYKKSCSLVSQRIVTAS